MVSKLGRNGRFIGCSNYPECDYTRSLEETAETAEEAQEKPGRDCPTCGKELIYKQGRYGKFIGCSGYPECKYIESLNKAEDTGVTCPLCNKNTLSKRKARRGNFFYSCQGYPKCKFIVSLGAGAKADPTRIHISDISDALADPLGVKIRLLLLIGPLIPILLCI